MKVQEAVILEIPATAQEEVASLVVTTITVHGVETEHQAAVRLEQQTIILLLLAAQAAAQEVSVAVQAAVRHLHHLAVQVVVVLQVAVETKQTLFRN